MEDGLRAERDLEAGRRRTGGGNCNEAGRTAARRGNQQHHQHLHDDNQADDACDGWRGMAEGADLAIFRMPADTVMMHEQRREEDHNRNAQNHRKDAKCERFAVSIGHMFWSMTDIATDIQVSVVL